MTVSVEETEVWEETIWSTPCKLVREGVKTKIRTSLLQWPGRFLRAEVIWLEQSLEGRKLWSGKNKGPPGSWALGNQGLEGRAWGMLACPEICDPGVNHLFLLLFRRRLTAQPLFSLLCFSVFQVDFGCALYNSNKKPRFSLWRRPSGY